MKSFNKNTNNSEPNGKRKERNSLTMILKMQSTGPPLSKRGTTSMKGLMKTNHYG